MRPARFLLAAALLASGPALAEPLEAGDMSMRVPLLPLDDVVSVPAEPDLIDRAEATALAAWRTVRGWAAEAETAATPLWTEVREQVGTAAETARREASPILASAGVTAGEAWERAGVLAGDAQLKAEELAAAFHEQTAELRAHPAVQAAADVGILLRVAEVIGVSALVGGLVIKKLRSA